MRSNPTGLSTAILTLVSQICTRCPLANVPPTHQTQTRACHRNSRPVWNFNFFSHTHLDSLLKFHWKDGWLGKNMPSLIPLRLCVERIIINQVCLNVKPRDSLQASVCDDLVRISEIPMALTKKQFLTPWEWIWPRINRYRALSAVPPLGNDVNSAHKY